MVNRDSSVDSCLLQQVLVSSLLHYHKHRDDATHALAPHILLFMMYDCVFSMCLSFALTYFFLLLSLSSYLLLCSRATTTINDRRKQCLNQSTLTYPLQWLLPHVIYRHRYWHRQHRLKQNLKVHSIAHRIHSNRVQSTLHHHHRISQSRHLRDEQWQQSLSRVDVEWCRYDKNWSVVAAGSKKFTFLYCYLYPQCVRCFSKRLIVTKRTR